MTPEDAAAAARAAQPLWSLVPARARARYVARAAVALLDELEDLALRLAADTGRPYSGLMLEELLPSVRGLRALADTGPRALADRRAAPRAVLLAGRSALAVQAPVGVVGLRGPCASPWAEPALEAAAALLAGNGVVLAGLEPLTATRLRALLLRAGVPGELVGVADPASGELATPRGEPAAGGDSTATGGDSTATRGGDALAAATRRVVELPRPSRRALLLVLPGAPRERLVRAALWAAFGRHGAEAGRLVAVRGAADGLVDALAAGAAQLRIGDPRDAMTDVGPLASPAALDLLAAALERAGDVRGGGPRQVAGFERPFWAPTVVGDADPDGALFRDPPPGPVLAVATVPDTEAAIALATRVCRDAPVSIWTTDPGRGERVARRLPAPVTWVGGHGAAPPPAPERLARYVAPRRLERRAARAPGGRWLPIDPDAVSARATIAEARHGREARRWPALKAGAGALVRNARRRGSRGS